jgi:extracellular elastinolytic metalloproteinase
MMTNLKHIFPMLLVAMLCFSAAIAQKSSGLVRQIIDSKQFQTYDSQYEITSEHLSSISGIRHIYFRQLIEDIPVEGTASSLHLASNGTVLSEEINFHPFIEEGRISRKPSYSSAKSAISSIARQMGYPLNKPLDRIFKEKKSSRDYWFTNGGISQREIKAQLMYVETKENTYELVWEIDILENSYEHWWIFQVNATTGAIVKKTDRMQTCFEHEHGNELLDYNKNVFNSINSEKTESSLPNACVECYEVFAFPFESPYSGDRTVEVKPANATASPFGWHDINGDPEPEFSVTSGNNVNAIEANDHFGYQPYGGLQLDFTGFPFDAEFSVTNQYEDASITNLFYWTNIMHDIAYQYGFDEVAGNFQYNNYGKEGKGQDPVKAHGQSINRRCNASFSTPPDGEEPLLTMNLCNSKDGNFDASVIAHEYGHGITSRLTGGGVFNNCMFHRENPSEGWSDWWSIILTMKADDTGESPRTIATYLLNQGPEGTGVRTYPYSTDMSINPLTYEDLSAQLGVHAIGAVWGQIIWEMTWALIDVYGFDPDVYNFTGDINLDAGNIMAMAIVTEGLKFTPCQPGFVDARDGILLAAAEIYGGDLACSLWPAFAKRGLGGFAEQGDPERIGDEIASFITPADGPIFRDDFEPFCLTGGVYENLTGGLPIGGRYEGPGVTDNGDGISFNFDPALVGEGVHSISYFSLNTDCASAFDVSKDLMVVRDVQPPEIACLPDVTINLTFSDSYLLDDFTHHVIVSDDCPSSLDSTQIPEVGTSMSAGSHMITILAKDVAGNEASCTFQLHLSFPIDPNADIEGEFLTIFPNPGTDEITVFNSSEKKISTVEIRDIRGRLISDLSINNAELENKISIELLASGTYFISVNLANNIEILRLVKR